MFFYFYFAAEQKWHLERYLKCQGMSEASREVWDSGHMEVMGMYEKSFLSIKFDVLSKKDRKSKKGTAGG